MIDKTAKFYKSMIKHKVFDKAGFDRSLTPIKLKIDVPTLKKVKKHHEMTTLTPSVVSYRRILFISS